MPTDTLAPVDWIQTTSNALLSLWGGFINFIPNLIGALLIFIIGWIVAALIGKIIAEVLRKIKFNQLFEKGGWKTALEKADMKVDVSGFVGAIFKWVLIIVFLTAAAGVLKLDTFEQLLAGVINYIPNVIVAVLVFVVAVIISDILEKIVRAAVEGARIGYAKLAGAIVKWSIWVFAIFIILHQLQVAPALIETLWQGILGIIVITVGLAFGLGGKETAAEILQDLRRKVKER